MRGLTAGGARDLINLHHAPEVPGALLGAIVRYSEETLLGTAELRRRSAESARSALSWFMAITTAELTTQPARAASHHAIAPS